MKGLLVATITVAVGLTAGMRAQSKQETVQGHLMDVTCAVKDVGQGVAAIEGHDKKCLLLDSCVKSGYAIVTSDLRVIKLDAKGNEQALQFVKSTDHDKDWRVAANGTITNGVMSVTHLALR